MEIKSYEVKIEGGEEIALRLELEGSKILKAEWRIVGGLALLQAAARLKAQMPKSISDLNVPVGNDPSILLLKELVMRVRGEWSGEEASTEICHCRKIALGSIERAIVLGAHSLEKVRKRCAANTGCGACMPDVMDLISKRVG